MKNFLIRTVGTAAFIILLNSAGFAQFSMGLQGGLAKSNTEEAKTVAGGGINLRVFTSPQFAFGVGGKIYAAGNDDTILGQTLSTNGTIMPVTGTVDYYFLTGLIRPYAGADAGVYFSKFDAEFNGNTILESSRSSNVGAAPRAGVVFAFGNLGIQVEGIYHFVFGNKNNSLTTGADQVDFETSTNFGGVNVGIIFGLGGK